MLWVILTQKKSLGFPLISIVNLYSKQFFGKYVIRFAWPFFVAVFNPEN